MKLLEAFLKKHLWMAASKLFMTSIRLNILFYAALLNVYLHQGLGGGEKWEWNCYVCALEREMWATAIGKSAAFERNWKERKNTVDYKADESEIYVSDLCFQSYSYSFSRGNGSESYFQEKMLQERVIVIGVYYLRKGPITMTIVSKKFPGLQILQ